MQTSPQLKSIVFVHPTNYLRFQIRDIHEKPTTLKQCTKSAVIDLGKELCGTNFSGNVMDVKNKLEACLYQAYLTCPLNQYPHKKGKVTLSLGAGLFQFVFHQGQNDRISTKAALSVLEVEVIYTALNLGSKSTKNEMLEQIMIHLYSLTPQSYPLTFSLVHRECAHAKCQRALDANRFHYCSRHHQQEVIARYLAMYTGKNDAMGVYLAQLLLDEALNKRTNNLQPRLQAGNPPPIPQWVKTNMDVFKLYKPYINLLLTALKANVDNSPNAAQRDQLLRSKQLASMFCSQSHTKVRLMDGHCGFLFLFISELIEKYTSMGMKNIEQLINRTCIELVDIDDDVTKWHRMMYPSFKCVTEDIFSGPITDTTLLYPNFCGVSKSWENVKRYLQHDVKVKEFLLSFSLRNARKKLNSLIAICSLAEHLKCTKLETGRNDFVTFIITNNQSTKCKR